MFQKLKEGLMQIVQDYNLTNSQICITSNALTPEEAIGETQRKDFPILAGKEIMIQASFENGKGQAFTDSPAIFKGSLEEVLKLDVVKDDYARALFVASLNAIMRQVGLVENTVHCKNGEPELCAQRFLTYIKETYGLPKIALIGYQPALLEHLSKEFQIRVLDLNPETIGTVKWGIKVEAGKDDFEEVVQWAELILCTGSTICNGSIIDFLNLKKEVLFFGTTLAGAAHLLGLNRVCFYSA
ncbi:Putative heavy-metal chelation [Anaeromicropila populeti]|uniref:Putative heavy-metal chelation n=2 Tax=Anaeromicropila populeti TaxID=37658 RepID=A0A1I6JAW3_9FIRM|nr:Putative heavy-metal chelation [Anaeromicropila populeti]